MTVVVVGGNAALAEALVAELRRADPHLFSSDTLRDGVTESKRVLSVLGLPLQASDTADEPDQQRLTELLARNRVLVWLSIATHSDIELLHDSTYFRLWRDSGPERALSTHSLAVDEVSLSTTGSPTDVLHASAKCESLLAIARRAVFAAACRHESATPFLKLLAQGDPNAVTQWPLSTLPPFVTSANIRRSVVEWPSPANDGAAASQDDSGETFTWVVRRDGKAQEGDVVFGVVLPSPTQTTPVWVVDSALRQSLYFTEPFFVVAPVGNRESTTHVSGIVPIGGLTAHHTSHWIGGESGLVGVLVAEGATANKLAETSVAFQMIGVVAKGTSSKSIPPHGDDDSAPVYVAAMTGCLTCNHLNVASLCRMPKSEALRIPVICVGATSAEAGKTTFVSKVIAALSGGSFGRRVGGVKATGTGGVVDCAAYRAAGAFCVSDQVDAGLPTTYTSAERIRERLIRALLLCQDAGAELLVVELGGDLIWANNAEFLRLPEVARQMVKLFVLCNDSLAALGLQAWLRQDVCTPNLLPPAMRCLNDQLCIVASPFRSFASAQARAARLNFPAVPLDPNNTTDLLHALSAVLAVK